MTRTIGSRSVCRVRSDDVKAFLRDVQAVAAADDPRDATVRKLQELSKPAEAPRRPPHRRAIAVPDRHVDHHAPLQPCQLQDQGACEGFRSMLERETLLVRVGYDTDPLSKPIVELQHAITRRLS